MVVVAAQGVPSTGGVVAPCGPEEPVAAAKGDRGVRPGGPRGGHQGVDKRGGRKAGGEPSGVGATVLDALDGAGAWIGGAQEKVLAPVRDELDEVAAQIREARGKASAQGVRERVAVTAASGRPADTGRLRGGQEAAAMLEAAAAASGHRA